MHLHTLSRENDCPNPCSDLPVGSFFRCHNHTSTVMVCGWDLTKKSRKSVCYIKKKNSAEVLKARVRAPGGIILVATIFFLGTIFCSGKTTLQNVLIPKLFLDIYV
ncbi:unnamed protein product [Eretmochelys imbricata]